MLKHTEEEHCCIGVHTTCSVHMFLSLPAVSVIHSQTSCSMPTA
jgi:hypothetical protein